jgi:uncharacterized protein (DUF2236 family)
VSTAAAHGADPGYFGPESVTWRVHADLGMFPAGLAALMLQALHPRALEGVLRGSGFRDDAQGRFARTAAWIGVCTYGTRDEADKAAARIRGVHRRLGVDAADLLLWVHVCEVVAFVDVVRACGLALTDADVDAYLTEQVVAAGLVGIPTGIVPRTRAECDDYFAEVRGELSAGHEAREVLRFLAFPPVPGWVRLTPGPLAWAGLASIAFGLLPSWARRMYVGPFGLVPGTHLTAELSGRVSRLAVRGLVTRLPERYQGGPHYRDARKRLGL